MKNIIPDLQCSLIRFSSVALYSTYFFAISSTGKVIKAQGFVAKLDYEQKSEFKGVTPRNLPSHYVSTQSN